MSPMNVTLTVLGGGLDGTEYEFHQPAVFVLGRAEECYPHLPNTLEYRDVSRHHCLLSINPPEVWVQDLGSKNGTFVNDEKIGQRVWQEAGDGAINVQPFNRRQLHDGDEIRLGHYLVYRVGVHVLQGAEA
jgi:pSer/pThr/pTyr-binding forkhead associated (FHA) protein